MPIQTLRLKGQLDTGIDVQSFPGIIPEYYERSACKAAHYRFDTSWQDLTSAERAEHVAHFYLTNIINQHKESAQSAHMNRKK